MSKVWVIMGNDFPSCVFDDEKKSEAYVEKMKAQDKAIHERDRPGWPYSPRIYWRSYEFEVK